MRLFDTFKKHGRNTKTTAAAGKAASKSRGGGAKRGRGAGGVGSSRPAFEQVEGRTLLSAGALDTTFGGGTGIVVTDFTGGEDQASSIVTLADGKMLVAGTATTSFDKDFALARYNADGSLDATFGVNGLVTTDLGSTEDIAHAMTVQADGKIVLAGRTRNTLGGTDFDFAVVRYNADGTLDSSFGLGGVALGDFEGLDDQAYAVALDAGGNILVTGRASDANWAWHVGVMRFDSSGALDTSFDADGKVMVQVPDPIGDGSTVSVEVFGIDLASDGKVVLGGYAFSMYTGVSDALVVRLNPDGSLDPTFGNDPDGDGVRAGYRTADLTWDDDDVRNVLVLSSGDILVSGNRNDFMVTKFTAAGDLDASFATGGTFVMDLAGMFFESARDLAIDASGKIYAAGFLNDGINPDFALMRFNPDGSLDTTFDGDGIVLTDFGAWDDEGALAMSLNGGTVTLAGYAGISTSANFALARYLTGDAGPAENVAPVAVAGGPYAVYEGASITLDGSGSTDADGTITSYEWDLDYDGVNFDADATGDTTSFSAASLDAGTRTIALRVTDDDGAVHVHSVTVAIDNVAPTANAGPDVSLGEGGTVSLGGQFSDAGSADTHTLGWQVLLNGQVVAGGSGASLDFTSMDDGLYTAVFTVTDDEGASSSDSLDILFTNVAPTASAGADVTVSEGGAVSLSGSFSDPGSDSHTVLWHVVASNGQVVADGTDAAFGFVANDNGIYTVTFTVTDDDGGSHTDTLVVTANNVAPTVLVAGDASGVRGQSRSLMGGFTDPGTLDTHQVRWDFGDGTSTAWQDVTDPNISTSHAWGATGTYNVTMYIRDKDGAVSSDSHAVTIKVYELQQDPSGFALVVGGTAGNDVIEFSKVSQQRVALYVNNAYQGTFNHSGRLIAFGHDGDDRISAFGLDNEAVLYGGAGDDSLTGGKGNDTLWGDAGADIFDGAQGTDTIHRDAQDPPEKGQKPQSTSAAAVRDTLNIISSRLRRGSPLRTFRF